MPSQLPSQTLPNHIHHHHHHCHYHCFPLLHRHHNHHLFFTKFGPSPLLCPCPLHHNHHHHHRFNSCSSNLHLIATNPPVISIPSNPCPVPAGFFSSCQTVSTAVEALASESGVQLMDQSEVLKLEDPGEEEELEDAFVLTDEWREFFAKSEAKRRMDKQQKNEQRKRGAQLPLSNLIT